MKRTHDKLIAHKGFEEGDQVLLYNSRLSFFPGKVRSRWIGPCIVTTTFPSGAVKIQYKDDQFIVNGAHLKLCHPAIPVAIYEDP